jgi:hypothetical protein
MESDNSAYKRLSHDAEWAGRHPQLDTSLTEAIRAPVVDERFDERVWALIRADESEALAAQKMVRMRLGTPWWLDSLNVIAIGATAVVIALAFIAVASDPVAESAAVALAVVEQPPESVRSFALMASAAALWLGLRQSPFVRALVRVWL